MPARALALLTCLLFAGCGTDAPQAPPPPATAALGYASVTPTATPAVPKGRHLTAAVQRPTWLRRGPDGRRIARITPKTEFGGRHVLAVTARSPGWLRVHTPALPNGRHAWIAESAVKLGSTNFSLHVDRSARRLQLQLRDEVVHTMPVAIGRPGNETPLGRFAVTDKLTISNPSSAYGCCAVALTGHQTKLVPGWVGGDRLAVHGTPVEASVGKEISLGCLRARETDLRVLMRRVPLGAPVFITA